MTVLAAALALGACATPVAVDSFCEKFQRTDFLDPGLRLLSPANKRANLANENTWERDCAAKPPHDR